MWALDKGYEKKRREAQAKAMPLDLQPFILGHASVTWLAAASQSTAFVGSSLRCRETSDCGAYDGSTASKETCKYHIPEVLHAATS